MTILPEITGKGLKSRFHSGFVQNNQASLRVSPVELTLKKRIKPCHDLFESKLYRVLPRKSCLFDRHTEQGPVSPEIMGGCKSFANRGPACWPVFDRPPDSLAGKHMAAMKLKPIRFFGAEFRCKPFESGRKIMHLTLEHTYARQHKVPLICCGDRAGIVKIKKIHLSEGSRAGAKSQRITKTQPSQPFKCQVVRCLGFVNPAVHVPASVITKASAQRLASDRTRPI